MKYLYMIFPKYSNPGDLKAIEGIEVSNLGEYGIFVNNKTGKPLACKQLEDLAEIGFKAIVV